MAEANKAFGLIIESREVVRFDGVSSDEGFVAVALPIMVLFMLEEESRDIVDICGLKN